MPQTKYIKISVDDEELDVASIEEVPVSISYKFEDRDDFQKKSGSSALNIKVPATTGNDKIANTFHNPTIEDLTPGEVYRNFRRGKIEATGTDLLVGKTILNSGSHTDLPTDYEFDFYGGNADWKIDLQETTLFDLLKHITFIYSKANIVASWDFDGTDEALPYVFAPVRYLAPMGGFDPSNNPIDDNMAIDYMRPSLSKYWIMYWAYKLVGYRVDSIFLNDPYFLRQVMPWTWGNFLDSEGTRLDTHKFLAKSIADVYYNSPSGRHEFWWNLDVSNDSTLGAFDANNDYSYDGGAFEMNWEYKPLYFGLLNANFSIQVSVDAGCNGTIDGAAEVGLEAVWFVNGVERQRSALVSLIAGTIGGTSDVGIKEAWFSADVNPNDIVTCKLYLNMYSPSGALGYASITANVLSYSLEYFKIPVGGTIDFENYTGLKKVKFLDALRGILDESNLAVQTDSVNKVVKFEPTHPYSLAHDQSVKTGGYFNGTFQNWKEKQDILTESKIDNFSDNEREMLFKYKNDDNDGILKVIQDRAITTLAACKYVLPARFKSGRQEVENRFFAPTMHYEVDQWKGLGIDTNTGIAPQIVCLIPENISNTSRSEASNTFLPKSCYYKGKVTGVGAWKFDGDVYQEYPFMFAVNYKDGGQSDPILSYSDEKIRSGGDFIVGIGLVKRFYWQRLAIMREGKYYNTRFRLINNDITNWFHREHIICRDSKWELIEINNYRPMKEESTPCFLRKWTPISQADKDNTYPASDTILNGTSPASNSFDMKYSPLKCLISDIPTV